MKQRIIALLVSLTAAGAFASVSNPSPDSYKVVGQQKMLEASGKIPEVNPYSALTGARGSETRETRYVVTGVIERTDGDQVWIRSGGRLIEVSSAGLTFHRGLFANDKVQAMVSGPAEHLQALKIISPAQEDIAD